MRDTHVIAKRGYIFLLLQNLGMLYSIVILSVDVMTGERRLCYLYVWVSIGGYIFYGLPLFMRTHIYCIRFNLAQERKLERPSPFFMKRLWLISPAFLMKLFLVLFILQIAVPIGFSIQSAVQDEPYESLRHHEAQGCALEQNHALSSFSYFFIAVYMFSIIMCVICLWKSSDAYYIKLEMQLTLIIWIAVVVIAYSIRSVPTLLVVYYPAPLNVTGMVGMILSCIVSDVFLIHWARQERKIFEADVDLGLRLESNAFRHDFAEFLCSQFAIENLLFWDAVQSYKRLPQDSEEQMRKAKIIYEKYIAVSSVCEVNLGSQTRQSIGASVRPGINVTADTFSVAEREVMYMLKFHSYPLYMMRRSSSSDEQTTSFSSTTTAAGDNSSSSSSSSETYARDNVKKNVNQPVSSSESIITV
eukprot:TRINITY_DN6733_c0_g1_i2.p1 TRINITY_DN6733_c0_g1~~TRINITY_DN6733_c0_g1_i2.p1  ORF type:complete len:460 (+),score=29.64 TRINITY_DN6733_c0_g1_i2:134-1381(+)